MRSMPPFRGTRAAPAVAIAVVAWFAASLTPAFAQGIPAFPGAEGFGSTTVGGRGGEVIEVTTLADSGPGSLREAMEVRAGPRIVIVRVGGTIELTREIVVDEAHSYLTVAGQKAPGDGIQLKNYGIVLRDGAHDIVIRHLRSRPGDTTPGIWDKDAVLLYGTTDVPVHDVIFDHVSAEWAVDENVNVWRKVENVTFQWCMIAEGSMTGHPKGPHSMGLLSGAYTGTTLSVHHCLLAHNADRNPLLDDNSEGITDFRNNVVYNWQNNNAGNHRFGSRTNHVANRYLAGPDTSTIQGDVFCVPDRENTTGVKLYVEGNWGPRCPTGCPEDDWDVGVWFWENSTRYEADPALYRAAWPFPAPAVTTHPQNVLVDLVLDGAGATLPLRDPVDTRIVAEVRTRSGHVGIGSPYPALAGGSPPRDADHDGIPDSWERSYGLDPHDPADGRGDLNGDGYTNVEEYLNDTDPTAPAAPVRAGSVPDRQGVPSSLLTLAKAAAGRLDLSWGASCQPGDADYEVYEGALGAFGSHRALYCSTGGLTSARITPAGADSYFLVVPRTAAREGSYGSDSSGVERPVGTLTCLERGILPCP